MEPVVEGIRKRRLLGGIKGVGEGLVKVGIEKGGECYSEGGVILLGGANDAWVAEDGIDIW